MGLLLSDVVAEPHNHPGVGAALPDLCGSRYIFCGAARHRPTSLPPPVAAPTAAPTLRRLPRCLARLPLSNSTEAPGRRRAAPHARPVRAGGVWPVGAEAGAVLLRALPSWRLQRLEALARQPARS